MSKITGFPMYLNLQAIKEKPSPVHPSEIRTSSSPSSAVEQLYTTSALANYATEEGSMTSTTMEHHPVPLDEPWGGVQAGERSTPIQEFYRDRSVFMTGASGFCGKILLSKLLRSCPYIGNIFILIRPKKNKSIAQRLEALLSEPVLVDLVESNKHQDVLKKIVLVPGDISQSNMGIFPEDRERLRREVSVVFHLAATLKFDENLKLALKTNVGGTQAVIELCKDMRHLKFNENLKLALKTNVGGTQAVIELCKDMRHLKVGEDGIGANTCMVFSGQVGEVRGVDECVAEGGERWSCEVFFSLSLAGAYTRR
uniref:Fatty acyl-CoA reductase n=1 Tax=Timema californicum TaxID=61474 RepID=A0A7R9PD54_TIMCA|nr:unnamed protein product [Timema californicum]